MNPMKPPLNPIKPSTTGGFCLIQSAVVCVFAHLHHRKGDRCAMDSGTDSVAASSSVAPCVSGSLWVPGGQTLGKPWENDGKMGCYRLVTPW